MYSLLKLRESLTLFFKRYENLIIFFAKFFIAYFVMKQITEINLYGNFFEPIFKPQLLFLICIMFSVCFNFMPLSISYFMMAFMLSLSFSKSMELAVIIFLSLLIILFLYIRIAAKESVFIFFTVLAFYFKLHFLVPIVAGLYFGLTSVIPITIATFLWRNFYIAKDIASTNETVFGDIFDLISVPEKIFQIFGIMVSRISANQQWILESLVLSMVVFLVFFVSKLTFDYAKEVAIVLGAIFNMTAFLFVIILTNVDISVGFVFFFSIIAMLLALAVKFFDNVLVYKSAERLEFDDDEFYYFVKIVPKIKISDLEGAQVKTKAEESKKEKIVEKPKIDEKPIVIKKPKAIEKPKVAEKPKATEKPKEGSTEKLILDAKTLINELEKNNDKQIKKEIKKKNFELIIIDERKNKKSDDKKEILEDKPKDDDKK